MYKVNNNNTKLISKNLNDVVKLWDFDMKVLDPRDAVLDGENVVGVSMVYSGKERDVCNVLSNKTIFSNKNATYFYFICGVYASLCLLLLDQLPKGS